MKALLVFTFFEGEKSFNECDLIKSFFLVSCQAASSYFKRGCDERFNGLVYGAAIGGCIGTVIGVAVGLFYRPSLGPGPAALIAGFAATIIGAAVGGLLGPFFPCTIEC